MEKQTHPLKLLSIFSVVLMLSMCFAGVAIAVDDQDSDATVDSFRTTISFPMNGVSWYDNVCSVSKSSTSLTSIPAKQDVTTSQYHTPRDAENNILTNFYTSYVNSSDSYPVDHGYAIDNSYSTNDEYGQYLTAYILSETTGGIDTFTEYTSEISLINGSQTLSDSAYTVDVNCTSVGSYTFCIVIYQKGFAGSADTFYVFKKTIAVDDQDSDTDSFRTTISFPMNGVSWYDMVCDKEMNRTTITSIPAKETVTVSQYHTPRNAENNYLTNFYTSYVNSSYSYPVDHGYATDVSSKPKDGYQQYLTAYILSETKGSVDTFTEYTSEISLINGSQTLSDSAYTVDVNCTSAGSYTFCIVIYQKGSSFGFSTSDHVYVFKKTINISDPRCIVTYNGNGGTSAKASDTVTPNSTVTLPDASRSGFQFAGWYTDATGGTKVGDAGDNYTVNSNIILYAHWSQPIIISSTPADTTHVGATYTYTPTANTTGFSITLTSNPSWLSVQSGVITGTVPTDASEDDFTFTMTLSKTGMISASQTISIHVYPQIEITNPSNYIIAYEVA